jgi:hypothetical protein
VLHLEGGGRIEGAVSREGDRYIVDTGSSRIVLRVEQVVRREAKTTPEERYAERLGETDGADFDAQVALARWCEEVGLRDAAHLHYEAAVRIRPDDAEARRKAGYRLHEGEWLTEEAWKRARGLEEYRGRWRPAEEVRRLRAEDAARQRRHEAFSEGWAIVRRTAREADGAPLDDAVRAIGAWGTDALPLLRRAAFDADSRGRELAIRALARTPGAGARALLLRRLALEGDGELLRLLLAALEARPERMKTMELLLDRAVNDRSAAVRGRAVLGLRALADPAVVEALLPLAAYTPVRSEEDSAAAEGSAQNADAPGKASPADDGGWTTTYGGGARPADGDASGSGAPLEPYYPACEALRELTGVPLPPDPGAWADWWERNRPYFRFQPVEGLDTARRTLAETGLAPPVAETPATDTTAAGDDGTTSRPAADSNESAHGPAGSAPQTDPDGDL